MLQFVLILELFITRGKNVEALQKVLQCAPLASKNQAVKVSFELLMFFAAVIFCEVLLDDRL